MVSEIKKDSGRFKRKKRGRKKVRGTEDRPRLVVYRSNKHIYAQIVIDTFEKVLLGASTLSKEIRGDLTSTSNTKSAQEVGALIARKAVEKGISKVVFDRNGFRFHGKVKALALAAREEGLQF